MDVRFEEPANTSINESAQSTDIDVDTDQPLNATVIGDSNGTINDFFSQTNLSGSLTNLFEKQALCKTDLMKHNIWQN